MTDNTGRNSYDTIRKQTGSYGFLELMHPESEAVLYTEDGAYINKNAIDDYATGEQYRQPPETATETREAYDEIYDDLADLDMAEIQDVPEQIDDWNTYRNASIASGVTGIAGGLGTGMLTVPEAGIPAAILIGGTTLFYNVKKHLDQEDRYEGNIKARKDRYEEFMANELVEALENKYELHTLDDRGFNVLEESMNRQKTKTVVTQDAVTVLQVPDRAR